MLRPDSFEKLQERNRKEMENFVNSHAEKFGRTTKKAVGLVLFIWLVQVLFSLGIIGAVICVAIHFISKYW